MTQEEKKKFIAALKWVLDKIKNSNGIGPFYNEYGICLGLKEFYNVVNYLDFVSTPPIKEFKSHREEAEILFDALPKGNDYWWPSNRVGRRAEFLEYLIKELES